MWSNPSRDGAGTPFDWVEAIGFGRAPLCTWSAGPWQSVAGPNGLAVGCFAWGDPDSGQVTNSQIDNGVLGFVLPLAGRYNFWERAYFRPGLSFPQMIIRAGLPCTLAIKGDFFAKFPYGGQHGDRVYADPVTGLPTTDDSAAQTPWTIYRGGAPNSRLPISSSIKPLN